VVKGISFGGANSRTKKIAALARQYGHCPSLLSNFDATTTTAILSNGNLILRYKRSLPAVIVDVIVRLRATFAYARDVVGLVYFKSGQI